MKKPHLPVKPIAPSQYLPKKVNEIYIASGDSLPDVLSQLNRVDFTKVEFCIDYYCQTCILKWADNQARLDPNYEKKLDKYLIKMVEYDKKMALYDSKMKEYKQYLITSYEAKLKKLQGF